MARKVNDIIEFSIDIEIDIPEDYDQSKGVDVSKFKREYIVSCSINETEENSEYSLDVEAGITPVEDNIKDYVKYEMQNTFSEVTDYEIIDIYMGEYDHQSAKIRVKAVKEA